jgi:hypothetical protein
MRVVVSTMRSRHMISSILSKIEVETYQLVTRFILRFVMVELTSSLALYT